MLYRTIRTIISIGLMTIITTSACLAMTDEEIEKMFDEALQESDTGDLTRAVSIFESILSERPAMERVRMELALTNFRALNYPAAKALVQSVLDKPSTPESVKNTIRTFLKQVEKQSKTHLWRQLLGNSLNPFKFSSIVRS